MERMDATIHGRVQGVSFRYYTIQEATRLGLTGWVANQRDGTVHLVAEGPAEALRELEQWLHRGPPAARVERVEASRAAATGEFERFTVRW